MKRKKGLGRGLDVLIPLSMESEQEEKSNTAALETEENMQQNPESSINESSIIDIKAVKAVDNEKTKENSDPAPLKNVDSEPEDNSESDESNNSVSAVNSESEGNPADHRFSDKEESSKISENGIVTMVRVTKVEPDRKQPRKSFDQDKLQELADSIKLKGLLEPIIVQNMGDHYEIIAGERRWRACKLAGLKEIPVIIKEYDELERMEISLIENIQREDLNPIEEANAYRRLIDEFHLKQDELAERVCKNRSSIANSMRLLKLCDAVQQMVVEEKLTMGHARALLSIEDTDLQKALAEEIVEKKLSVRDTEKKIRELLSEKKEKAPKKKDPALELIFRDLERKMNASLGMKVAIKNKGQKSGRVEISYDSQDDLEKLMDRLMR